MAHSLVPGAPVIEATPDGHRSSLRWLILLMAVASAVCAMMSTISFAPIIGIVAQDLGTDLGSASFAFIGIPTSAMAIGMAICGFLVDRVGVFRIVIASLSTLIATYIALAAFGHSFAAVLGIRVVQGLCSAGLMVSITPAIAAWFPSGEIGRAMGFPSIGAGVGTIIGLNTGPQLIHSTGSWQYGTSMLAVIAAAALAVPLPLRGSRAAMSRRPWLLKQKTNNCHRPEMYCGCRSSVRVCSSSRWHVGSTCHSPIWRPASSRSTRP
jgi:MFS family permease